MKNQNNIVHDLDDSYKGRNGIKEIIDNMMNTTDDSDSENNNDNIHSKTTA